MRRTNDCDGPDSSSHPVFRMNIDTRIIPSLPGPPVLWSPRCFRRRRRCHCASRPFLVSILIVIQLSHFWTQNDKDTPPCSTFQGSRLFASAQGLPALFSAADYDYLLHIAYVGNSFTYFNRGFENSVGDLVALSASSPGVTEAAILPTTAGSALTYGGTSQAGAGLKFPQHVANFAANSAIFDTGTAWDWVVFQDQSQVPVGSCGGSCLS
jgi:hypothetical protein